MFVVALAALVVKADEAFPVQHINQAVLEGMVTGRHRAGQFPYFHLNQPAVGQALTVLLEQFGLRVGILDIKLMEVKMMLPV